MTEVRKGQAPKAMARGEFALRFRAPFSDPAFETEKDALARLEEIAWQGYSEGHAMQAAAPAAEMTWKSCSAST